MVDIDVFLSCVESQTLKHIFILYVMTMWRTEKKWELWNMKYPRRIFSQYSIFLYIVYMAIYSLGWKNFQFLFISIWFHN